MNITHVNSSSNSLLKRVRALHERKQREKHQQFLIEGDRGVSEAFRKGLTITDVLVSEDFLLNHGDRLREHRIESVTVVNDKIFHEIAATTAPSGILAVAQIPSYRMADLFCGDKSLIVVANGIQDPGNLGTIVRTALAAYATGIILIKGTVDPFNPKVVRSAMGALFAIPLALDLTFSESMDLLRSHSIHVIGLDASGSKLIYDCELTGPTALVLGNEGNGFTSDELKQVDEVVSIPMNPLSESLNVSVSAAVALYSIVEQRIKC